MKRLIRNVMSLSSDAPKWESMEYGECQVDLVFVGIRSGSVLYVHVVWRYCFASEWSAG